VKVQRVCNPAQCRFEITREDRKSRSGSEHADRPAMSDRILQTSLLTLEQPARTCSLRPVIFRVTDGDGSDSRFVAELFQMARQNLFQFGRCALTRLKRR
jgi:hypothetical protein